MKNVSFNTSGSYLSTLCVITTNLYKSYKDTLDSDKTDQRGVCVSQLFRCVKILVFITTLFYVGSYFLLKKITSYDKIKTKKYEVELMINEFNIKIFDYIFSTNIGINGDYLEDNNIEKLCLHLDEIISKICNIYDFWNEYKIMFNDECVLDASTLDKKEYIYNGFPRMKLDTKKEYLNFKMKQIRKSICDNGAFLKEEFEKITENIINEGKKEILDFCEEIKIIRYKGKVFVSADDSPAALIIYDNIVEVMYNEKEVSTLVANNVIIVNGDSNHFGNIEQNNDSKINDEELFGLVLSKLDLLEKEGVSKSDIEMLRNECKNKNKGKILSFISDIASGGISSIVAAGIISKLGLS